MTASEFSRRARLDEIGSTPRAHRIAAEEEERRLLSERFGLAGVDMLEADIALSREAAGVRARGRVRAAVSQICVVSGQPVPAQVDEQVEVLFVPEAAPSAEEELEIDANDCDTLPLEGEAVDLGELAAETMSLALDPYPRLPDDELAEYRRLLLGEEEAAEMERQSRNPFAALKKP